MSFIPDAENVAKRAIQRIDPTLEDKFTTLVGFLSLNPDSASKLRGNQPGSIGSEGYIQALAKNFTDGRTPKTPQAPATVPDEMVSIVLQYYFDVDASHLDRIKVEHALSMGAENIVGDLLERYLASVLEPLGWVWCSGSLVKAVDFVKPPTNNRSWIALQVKNRDNSENSSSSAIRLGTTIEKWHRTFSKKAGSNWAAFPDADASSYLSEVNFRAFVSEYLMQLKNSR